MISGDRVSPYIVTKLIPENDGAVCRVEIAKNVYEKDFDNQVRLTAMTGNGKTTAYGYDDAGRRTNAIWPNGVTASCEYDAAGQLLGLVHRSGATPLASFEYGYDLSGSRTNMVTLEGTNSYAYDARNWLVSASYPDGRTEEFGYDPVGNRVHLGGTGVNETDYTYGPVNRLLSSESAAETNIYSYDAAGRLTNHAVNGNSRLFEYSFRSQMISLTDTNGQVFAYAFDGDGNRISQDLNDCLSARYVYDGPNVVLELNGSNEVIHAVVNGPGIDQPVERIAYVNGEPRLRQVYHTDGLGSVALMTDESKNPVKTYAYDAFGRIRSETGELVMNRWTYTGREALGDSEGLYYYRWRVMDPNTGRFTSEDPLGFVDGPNRYGYAKSSPFTYVDPLGLNGFDWGEFWRQIVDGIIRIFDKNPIPRDTINPDMHRDLLQIANCQKAKRELECCLMQADSDPSVDCSDAEAKVRAACEGIE